MTAEYTPQGNIGKYSDAWIEASLDWTGRKGFLVQCLIDSGWLDYEGLTILDPLPTHSEWVGNRKLFVHDWEDHADSAVSKRLQRLGLQFLKVTPELTVRKLVTDQKTAASRAHAALPEPLPEPEPPPSPPVSPSEWPLTAAAVRRIDAAANGIFVARLVQATIQAAISAGDVDLSEVNDNSISDAIVESVKTGPKRHGAGLLLNRVPQIIITWAHQD